MLAGGTAAMRPLETDAQWIWCGGEERPKNFYLHARRTFTIIGETRRAVVRLTADSRYVLFVNGSVVALGPARSDRRWQCLDEWEITHLLRPGGNVIAALIHHYGEWTFAYMLGRGGFLAEVVVELADGGKITVTTDASWRVKPSQAWERALPRMSIQTGFPEVYDARKDFTGWTRMGYADSEWESAIILGPAGMEPWPRLIPREIPAMSEIPLRPERVIDSGEVGSARTGHYVDLLRVVWSTKNGVAYLATFVWSPADLEAEIHAGSQEALRLWVNGKMVINHLVTRDPAPDQEIAPVRLARGWNAILAKIVQGEGQWHFYFRLETPSDDWLVYSRLPEGDPARAGSVSPWWLIGPFESAGVQQGFDALFPPEQSLDLNGAYPAGSGREIRWISAGVTEESMLTSVVMSREPRVPASAERIDNLDGLIQPGLPALLRPGAPSGLYAVIDFGKEVAGYPVIEIDRAQGGEIIDMGYAEVLQTPEGAILGPTQGAGGIVNPDRAGVHYADRYICKAGKQRFRTFDKRAFRYLQLDVRNLHQPILLGPVSILLSTYPVEERGSFSCSDAALNRIWEVGRWTVRLTMEDAYTDCPWRERGQWWGDARVQALINYYAFGDLKLIRQGLRQIGQSQRDDGLTMGIYPTDWSYGILPTFTLLWVISLRDYYEHSGDRALVTELFPRVERAMKFFETFRRDHGLLRDVPHWLFVDWADVETEGESASVNALFHGALLVAAQLAHLLGLDAKYREYALLADDVRKGMMDHLWDPAIHCFRDGWRKGKASPNISEQANCWAITFGVARDETADSVIEALFGENRATVRTGTPYFAFYVLDALARRGRHGELLNYVRHHWNRMLDWGATTWWETWEPKASFCHGWSAGPTYFLQAEILGVKPGSPGWESITIHPHPAGLTRAQGTVPTPHGTISAEWTLDKDFALDVSLPAPARVIVPAGAIGKISVTGSASYTDTIRAGQNASEVEIHLREPGTYRIQSS
jgi:alpha-L-rhamnosidase